MRARQRVVHLAAMIRYPLLKTINTTAMLFTYLLSLATAAIVVLSTGDKNTRKVEPPNRESKTNVTIPNGESLSRGRNYRFSYGADNQKILSRDDKTQKKQTENLLMDMMLMKDYEVMNVTGPMCYKLKKIPTKVSPVRSGDITLTGMQLFEIMSGPQDVQTSVPFLYYGKTYANVDLFVSAYGAVSLSSSISNIYPLGAVYSNMPQQVIAPYYTDFDNIVDGAQPFQVLFQEDVAVIIVQWNNFPGSTAGYISGATATFQLQIHTDGGIYFLYKRTLCDSPNYQLQVALTPLTSEFLIQGALPIVEVNRCSVNSYIFPNPEVVYYYKPVECTTLTGPTTTTTTTVKTTTCLETTTTTTVKTTTGLGTTTTTCAEITPPPTL